MLLHRERGATVENLIVDLLGLAQAEVGSRWERNKWSAAEEHAATAVTDAALAALTTVYEPCTHRGLVVLTCAEGEWHSLPARMAAEVLRAHGWGG